MLDLDAAERCLAIYAGGDGFDDFLEPESDSGICWALRRGDGVDDLVFRGSANLPDWLRDLTTLPHRVIAHPKFGPVHEGMYEGMEDAFLRFSSVLRKNVKIRVQGHSLGAARASYAIGLLIDDGWAPGQIEGVLFGCPKPGFQELADFLSPVPIRSYRNGQPNGISHDVVTDVPFTLWPLFPFKRVRPTIDVTAPPVPNDSLGIFAWHRMGLYVASRQDAAVVAA